MIRLVFKWKIYFQAIQGRDCNSKTDSELYFNGDSSSYTAVSSLQGANDSVMYEEIAAHHRYDKIHRPSTTKPAPPAVSQRPVNRSTAVPVQAQQRSSWDGHNGRFVGPGHAGNVAGLGCVSLVQPRSRHSADTSGQEAGRLFSPIVVPKFKTALSAWSVNANQQHPPPPPPPTTSLDISSFVPYRRAAVAPKDNSNNVLSSSSFNGGRMADQHEVYENVTDLDFDDHKKQPRTLSPDEEVAILTSQFRANAPQVGDAASDTTRLDSDCGGGGDDDDDDDSIRAVNV